MFSNVGNISAASTELLVSRSLITVAQQIQEDWEVNGRDWTQPGFRALAVHRIGAWLQQKPGRGPLRTPLRRLYLAMFRYVRNHYGIELPATTAIGRRVLISHQHGIVIHGEAVIGDECIIRQNVTIGAAVHHRAEAPVLGRGVQVGSGAAILGAVTIGDEARIGPNTVVMTDVPAGATVFVDQPRVMQMRRASRPGDGEREVRIEAGVGIN